ncbi:PilT/PilU family type 4a pilus ATPase [Alkalinema sp. FACHB-956]|uniref:type IV pilus twitching motility protein PilT n=1 Tax=Alkalinema sp. FACHB-956 TaxID=2692768 RepID=UPI001685599A|nr:PilT/PilU family type 4a pilus ATPase [Alkalinema sp. FACHB-956]MBD2328760.1 PilT/PilU family type 4a pilus ATPase [Alkalinema sp. FACHB-956]
MTAIQANSRSATDQPSEFRQLIYTAYHQGATALYIQIGRSPFYRLHGKLMPQAQLPIVTPERFSQYVQDLLPPDCVQIYRTQQKLDTLLTIPGFVTARINCGPTTQGIQSLSISNIQLETAPEHQPTTVLSLVQDAHQQGASDIHLQVGELPRFRIQGQIQPQPSYGIITARQFDTFLEEVLSPEQRTYFHQHWELDTAIYYPNLVRCRLNCAQSIMGGVMVLRLISLHVPTIADLSLPEILGRLAEERQGLVLVTGPVNTGKSTTLAAMLRHVNDSFCRKIVTIEDPIEYIHTSNQSLITQREVGLHTHEFKEALRSALRQDPDILLVGEMRDRETVDTAIRAALTGHLVLGTLHTKGTVNALKRILNFYTPEEQETVRHQIVEAMQAVLSQVLVPTPSGARIAALEIMLNTETIRDYLQKGDLEAVSRVMEEGKDGAQTLNQALYDLHHQGHITEEEALAASMNPDDLHYMLKNVTRRSSRSGLHSKDYREQILS